MAFCSTLERLPAHGTCSSVSIGCLFAGNERLSKALVAEDMAYKK